MGCGRELELQEGKLHYRIYIDETGTCSMSKPSDENNRYLGLTGIIMEENYARKTAAPTINTVKKNFFGDQPVVLHRTEIINKRGPFSVLDDNSLNEQFNSTLLWLIDTLQYKVITAIIDKNEHLQRYEVWRAEPYHYCMEVLLERYCLFLKVNNSTGDVIIEARSKKQDKKLKKAYKYYRQNGTTFVNPEQFQSRITGGDIKFSPKTANIAGLQLADLLAHPSAVYAKAVKYATQLPDNFGGRIANILHEKKYHRSRAGKIIGYGVKWLP